MVSCNICLEDIDTINIVKCDNNYNKHIYCNKCFEDWIIENIKRPLYKKNIKMKCCLCNHMIEYNLDNNYNTFVEYQEVNNLDILNNELSYLKNTNYISLQMKITKENMIYNKLYIVLPIEKYNKSIVSLFIGLYNIDGISNKSCVKRIIGENITEYCIDYYKYASWREASLQIPNQENKHLLFNKFSLRPSEFTNNIGIYNKKEDIQFIFYNFDKDIIKINDNSYVNVILQFPH